MDLVVPHLSGRPRILMPVVEWKRLLEGTRVPRPGIEIRYQPVPNGPATMMGPRTDGGAALPLLHGGADGSISSTTIRCRFSA